MRPISSYSFRRTPRVSVFLGSRVSGLRSLTVGTAGDRVSNAGGAVPEDEGGGLTERGVFPVSDRLDGGGGDDLFEFESRSLELTGGTDRSGGGPLSLDSLTSRDGSDRLGTGGGEDLSELEPRSLELAEGADLSGAEPLSRESPAPRELELSDDLGVPLA